MIRMLRLAAALLAVVAAPALLPGPARASAIDLPRAREVRLPNGAMVILAEKHDVPLIAFRAILRGGSLADAPGKEGVASLTGGLLRKGAGKRTAQEIAALVDGLGAALDTGSGLEHTYVAGEFMARDQAVMLDILGDLLRRPAFPADEFEKLKSQSIDAITAGKDDPPSVIDDYAYAFLYGDHPYGRPSEGDETTIRSITREDVLRYYRDNYGGDRLILSVVGDFSAPAMESRIRAKLGDWPKAAAPLSLAPAAGRRAGRRVLLVDKPDATQSYFWMGNVGVRRLDPDRVPLDVANTAYGGRFTSILTASGGRASPRRGRSRSCRTPRPRPRGKLWTWRSGPWKRSAAPGSTPRLCPRRRATWWGSFRRGTRPRTRSRRPSRISRSTVWKRRSSCATRIA